MNKETIEQIKKIPGVKTVTSVSEQLPNSENTVIVVFEPEINHRDLITREYEKGRLLEYRYNFSTEWNLWTTGVLDWEKYEYRIADPDWMQTLANIDSGLANRIITWFDGAIVYNEF